MIIYFVDPWLQEAMVGLKYKYSGLIPDGAYVEDDMILQGSFIIVLMEEVLNKVMDNSVIEVNTRCINIERDRVKD